MGEASWEQQAALVAEALNLLAVVASPRLYARWCTQAPAAELRAALEARLTVRHPIERVILAGKQRRGFGIGRAVMDGDEPDRVTFGQDFCRAAQGSPDAERFRAATPQVQALAEAVTGAPPEKLAEPRWTLRARECLEALGFPAPPEGWDAFEGGPVDNG